jgi:hypothetical protein
LCDAAEVDAVVPIRGTTGETPHSQFEGDKTDVTHIRAFGCLCYPTTVDPKIKFGEKAPRGVYLGRSVTQPAYIVFIPAINKLVATPHVAFVETVFPGVGQGATPNPIAGRTAGTDVIVEEPSVETEDGAEVGQSDSINLKTVIDSGVELEKTDVIVEEPSVETEDGAEVGQSDSINLKTVIDSGVELEKVLQTDPVKDNQYGPALPISRRLARYRLVRAAGRASSVDCRGHSASGWTVPYLSVLRPTEARRHK